MAIPSLKPLDAVPGRPDLVGNLLELYRNELEIYRRVLALSHQQGAVVKRGGSFQEVRKLLEEKNRCLAVIARLEKDATFSRTAWERDRDSLTTADRSRVHRALQAVADLIEEILVCEERNDNELIRRTGVLG